MRFLLLSDIHANKVAFDAVLREAERLAWDEVVFLGDIVGYYTDAEACVAELRRLAPTTAILGNHDAMLLELANGGSSDVGQRVGSLVVDILRDHLEQLSEESLTYLRSLHPHVVRQGWEATHGALRKPWDYLATTQNALQNFPLLSTRVCLVGHTHVPKVFAAVRRGQGELWRTVDFHGRSEVYRVPPKASVFLNPGSVGQSRDGYPLASFALFDDQQMVFELHRVEYDLVSVQRKVRVAGYPEALASRLALGR